MLRFVPEVLTVPVPLVGRAASRPSSSWKPAEQKDFSRENENDVAQMEICFPQKVHIFATSFPPCDLPTLRNEGAGSLLTALTFEMAAVSANQLCQTCSIRLGCLWLRESSLHGRLARWRGEGTQHAASAVTRHSQPVTQPGIMRGERDCAPHQQGAGSRCFLSIPIHVILLSLFCLFIYFDTSRPLNGLSGQRLNLFFYF